MDSNIPLKLLKS